MEEIGAEICQKKINKSQKNIKKKLNFMYSIKYELNNLTFGHVEVNKSVFY